MPAEGSREPPGITTLNENPLHAALKEWYARRGDRVEVDVDGYHVDVVRGKLLIEIQTRNFASLKRKLEYFIRSRYPVRLVHPVSREKWVVRLSEDGQEVLSRRKSPKRGFYEHVFDELTSFPKFMLIPSFSLEVLLIQEEEVRRHAQGRRWRRKGWATVERRLLDVVGRQCFREPRDLAALMPSGLPEQFTTLQLASAMGKPRRFGQKMAYCLREMNIILPVGRQGRSILYARADRPEPAVPE